MPSLGKFIKHKSQHNDKFQVTLQIHTAFGINETSPTSLFFVSYRRGDHRGSSMKLNLSSPKTIVFDQTCCFSFPCTLYYNDINHKNYEQKLVTLSFHKESESDPEGFSTLGKAHIDLSIYAKEVAENATKSFPLTEILAKYKKGGDALKVQVTLTLKSVLVLCDTKINGEEESDPPALTTPPRPLPTTRSSSPSAFTPISSTSFTPISFTPPLSSSFSPPPSTPSPPPPPSSTPLPIPRAPSPHPPPTMLRSSSPLRSSSSNLPAPSPSTRVPSLPHRPKDEDSGSSISSFSSISSGSDSPPPSPPLPSHLDDPVIVHTPPTDGSVRSGSSGGGRRRTGSIGVGRENGAATNGGAGVGGGVNGAKSYLVTPPPTKLHLLERQASDSRLNINDIAKRLASKHPELCAGNSPPTEGKESPTTPTRSIESKAPPRRAVSSFLTGQSLRTEGKTQSLNNIKLDPVVLKQELLQKQKEKQDQALQRQQDDERYLTEEVMRMPPTYSNGIPVLAYILFRTLLQWRAFHPNHAHILTKIFEAFKNLDDIPKNHSRVEVLLYRLSSVTTLLHILRKELQVLCVDNVSSTLRDFETRLKEVLTLFHQLYFYEVKEELDEAIHILLVSVKKGTGGGGSAKGLTSIFERHLKLLRSSVCFEALQQQLIYQIFYYCSARILNALLQGALPCQCSVGLALKMVVLDTEKWASAQSPPSSSSPRSSTPIHSPLASSSTTPTPSRSSSPSPSPRKEPNGVHTNGHVNGTHPDGSGSEENGERKGVHQLQCDVAAGWLPASCRKGFSAARQAADVLVVSKTSLIHPNVREEVCPSLNQQQLLALLERYVPDEFDAEPIHPGVLKSIRESTTETKPTYLTTDENTQTFLLPTSSPPSIDTHFTFPLLLNAISLPPHFSSRPGFAFLRDVNMDKYNQPW